MVVFKLWLCEVEFRLVLDQLVICDFQFYFHLEINFGK